ncbi:uncharacterized protein LOC113865670 [Abrus precatorius]|uniref:Uncharacterized protein LOC113865670 n=1 Tax=Abrus precatorius TaxID=3816 RepID=A0A8B8LIV4_ABRPR|nr:uncharacterized protein LOC113865670 [Abrus precatorius]
MKKRKEFGYEFPSIFPAAKSRRLERECELYSAMMEEEANVTVNQPCVDPTPASVTATEERALVLYDPSTTPFLKSPSSSEFSIVVKADLIPGLKDYLLSWGAAKQNDPVEDAVRREKNSEVSKDGLAVVPWVAFHSPMACEEIVPETGQPLEAEEGELMEMD